MRRREFIAGLGSAAAWPLVARAQQASLPVVGFLHAGSAWENAQQAANFRQGLSESGYAEGSNVQVEYRWADGHYERLPTLVADLVRRQVAVIVTSGGSIAALAAKAATTTIPIVFTSGVDPVEIGLVASLNRPGANLTGVSSVNVDLVPKRLELLHQLVPMATIIALLVNPTNPGTVNLPRNLPAAARTLGLQLHVLGASTELDFTSVFATLVQLQAGGLLIAPDGLFQSRIEELAALALRHAVPTIYQFREFAAAGGLMSYSDNSTYLLHQVGIYAGRILKGEKPGDLPVAQPTKFEFVINAKTAKALGLTIPETLLATADEVIQ
jgi:putative ABC transport system substrate-binding protein